MAVRARKSAKKRRPDEEVEPQGPRPYWSGTISFGLVSVPVNIYSAVRPGGVPLRMLAPDGAPVQRRYFCPEEERDVSNDELVRGYEVAPEEYVVLTDEELESIAPRKSRDIDLRRFVDAGEIDPMLFESAFVLTPAGETTKPYRLLAEAMEREHKVGIATAVMRNKEYLIAILAEGGILRAETLRFGDEVRKPGEVGLPKRAEPPPKLVHEFERAIEAHEKAGLAPSELEDERVKELRALAERKRRKHEDVVERPESEAKPDMDTDDEDGTGASSDDLFETIRRSLAATRGDGAGTGTRAPRARPVARARGAKRSTAARTGRARSGGKRGGK